MATKNEPLMSKEQIKKRLCCPPLQAEVEIYQGMAEALPDDLLGAYNEVVSDALALLATRRAAILARLEARR